MNTIGYQLELGVDATVRFVCTAHQPPPEPPSLISNPDADRFGDPHIAVTRSEP